MIEIRKAEQRNTLPEVDLWIPVTHDGKSLDLALFGSSDYRSNVSKMHGPYWHSKALPTVSFGSATTAESISAVHQDIKLAKELILDPKWLQLGYIVKASEGVFANPPVDEQGNPIIDEKTLKFYLQGVEPVKVGEGVIYIVSDSTLLRGFGFAPYESFKTGKQDGETFAEGGLARVLEHASGKAEKLGTIASSEFYPRQVDVVGFDKVEGSVLRVAGLGSCCSGGRLGVGGGLRAGGWRGSAFGVARSGEASAQK